ncbi:MAG: sulfite exporter TauE/SafE family protein, partial [Myxococcales bacterium]|nr:sulfite exporter TauE/SafE family protein [Myxococcales bacterium]
MTPGEALLLLGCGLVAGTVNTLAGGGSLLTVPVLVLLGLPGT